MALSTTTIVARLMPFGAPSTPSAMGRLDPFAEPSANDRYLRIPAFHRDQFERQQWGRFRPFRRRPIRAPCGDSNRQFGSHLDRLLRHAGHPENAAVAFDLVWRSERLVRIVREFYGRATLGLDR